MSSDREYKPFVPTDHEYVSKIALLASRNVETYTILHPNPDLEHVICAMMLASAFYIEPIAREMYAQGGYVALENFVVRCQDTMTDILAELMTQVIPNSEGIDET